MTTIQKTDVTKSPLLTQVIHRDYTRGIGESSSQQPSAPEPPAAQPGQASSPGQGGNMNFEKPPVTSGASPGAGPMPGDTTREFSFEEENTSPSDLGEGETSSGLKLPPGSARTFANTVGNMMQIYLPRAAYGYAKIDIDNVLVHVQRGEIQMVWIDTFNKINQNTERALKIPDESMKMWKAAFQHWLEYKNIQVANPTTELILATGAILTEMGIMVVTCRKDNEEYVKQALAQMAPNIKEQPAAQDTKADKTQNTEVYEDKRVA